MRHHAARPKVKNKIPKALSVGEETFALQCEAYEFKPEREYRFCEGRKWAFDFAFPKHKIAIEIEGGTIWGKSRHSFGEGFEEDCQKYNEATRLGWKVFRYSTRMVVRGQAIFDLIKMSDKWAEPCSNCVHPDTMNCACECHQAGRKK